MYFVVYCLCHPSYENSDAWIIDVYQDEKIANEIVEKLNNAFNSYWKRRDDLLTKSNVVYTKTRNDDVFEKWRNERSMNNEEIENLKSIHSRALKKYSYYDDVLEYKCDVIKNELYNL